MKIGTYGLLRPQIAPFTLHKKKDIFVSSAMSESVILLLMKEIYKEKQMKIAQGGVVNSAQFLAGIPTSNTKELKVYQPFMQDWILSSLP